MTTDKKPILPNLNDAIVIIKNLREKQKKYETEYGSNNRKAKKYWEERADDFLSRFKNK